MLYNQNKISDMFEQGTEETICGEQERLGWECGVSQHRVAQAWTQVAQALTQVAQALTQS